MSIVKQQNKTGGVIPLLAALAYRIALRGFGLSKPTNRTTPWADDELSSAHAIKGENLGHNVLRCQRHGHRAVCRKFLTRGTSDSGRDFQVYQCAECGDFVALGDYRDPGVLFRGRGFKERTYRRPVEATRRFRAAATLLAVVLSLGIVDQAKAQKMDSGWYWPTGTGDFGGYLGWLGYNNSTYPYHLAQDMRNPLGEAVYSIGEGTVLDARTDVNGYGPDFSKGGALVARYQSADGTWFTALYGHLDSPHAAGTIHGGEVLGYNNAFSPPHLHFGIHPGYDPEPTNPWRGYTSSTTMTYGFTEPILFLNSHPPIALATAKAELITPTPGSTLPGSTVTFTWAAGKGVERFFFYLGRAQGANDIIGQDQGTGTSVTITGIPTDGRTIFARIWSFINGAWQYSDSTYTTKR